MNIFETILGIIYIIIFVIMMLFIILLVTYNDTTVANTYQVEVTVLQVRLHSNRRNWVVVGEDTTSEHHYFEIGLLELNTVGEKAILTYQKTRKNILYF